MIVCPFAPKYHCRPTCVFRAGQGKIYVCLIREALLKYLNYTLDIKEGKDIDIHRIKEEP